MLERIDEHLGNNEYPSYLIQNDRGDERTQANHALRFSQKEKTYSKFGRFFKAGTVGSGGHGRHRSSNKEFPFPARRQTAASNAGNR